MIIYSVQVSINCSVENEWLEWMQKHHIPDVMNTNYFDDWKMFKVLEPEDADNQSVYLIEYSTDSLEKYRNYIEKESNRLREEHTRKFAGQFTASRSLLKRLD